MVDFVVNGHIYDCLVSSTLMREHSIDLLTETKLINEWVEL